MLRIDAGAGVAHFDQHCVRVVTARNDRELAGAILDRAHGVDRIEDEVEKHLLELHPVAVHPRQSLGELGPQHDVVAPDFIRGKLDHLRDLDVDVDQVLARRLALHQRADPADDLARAPAVGGNALERAPRLHGFGRIGREPARAGGRVRHHRTERLVHFVGDRRGELAEHGHARNAGELRSSDLQRVVLAAQLLLGELALADVAREGEIEALVALLERADADLDGQHGSILAADAAFRR